jgi:predicted nuclease of predicted toxin-antitoxin system
MKLLLDQNISAKIILRLSQLFPDSAHVSAFGLHRASDERVWQFAKSNGYAIVSKDTDFLHRGLLLGHPPKIILLRVGNGDTETIFQVLAKNQKLIGRFGDNAEESVLSLHCQNSIT